MSVAAMKVSRPQRQGVRQTDSPTCLALKFNVFVSVLSSVSHMLLSTNDRMCQGYSGKPISGG